MKNKFEALKAFMNWPREWQELCAEFWASDDEPDQQRFTAINLEVAKIPTTICNPFDCIDQGETKLNALPSIGDPWPYDEPSPELAPRIAKVVNHQRWTTTQEEALVACVDNAGCRSDAIRSFLKKYPGRSEAAIAIKIRGMTDANGVMHVRY